MAKKTVTLFLLFALLVPGCASTGGGAAERNRQARSWSKSVEQYRAHGNKATSSGATSRGAGGHSTGEIAGTVAAGTAYIAGAIALEVLLGLLGG